MNILCINIDQKSKKEVLQDIENFLTNGTQNYIVTPNPEILLKAQKDEELFYILNHANLSILDGIGIKISGWLLGKNVQRITGADLTCDILSLAEKKNLKVCIAINPNSLSQKKDIQKSFSKLYPKLKYEILINTHKKSQTLNSNVSILISTLGAPYQEKFNYHTLKENKNIKLAIGVGGSIDYLTHKAIRAPLLIQGTGLEWLWRLILYPKRYKRIFNATIIYPIEFFKWRFIKPHFYRPNVVCMLYKTENKKHKIIITERNGETGLWQLPQGGTDGEDLLTAGTRELTEELGTKHFIPIQTFKKIHKYKFKSPHAKRIMYGHKGQSQGLFVAKFTGKDSDINICPYEHQSWRWIDAELLVNEVEDVRKESTAKFLKLFQQAIKNNP